jgi:hypothetical protein
VSIGNILSYNGQAKLADLEYAKKMGDLTRHEMRTASEYPITLTRKPLITSQQGTKDFMSIEVAAQRFLFPPGPGRKKFVSQKAGKTNVTTGAPFFHNHLHDLESLWWVAVWVVFYNHISEGTPSRDRSSPAIKDALALAEPLFPPGRDFSRHNGFQLPTFFQEICGQLPSNKQNICNGLDVLRGCLVEHYRLIEARLPESVDLDSSKDDIYEDFTQVFTALETDTHDLELVLIRDIERELSAAENSKHPQSDSTKNTRVAQKGQKK